MHPLPEETLAAFLSGRLEAARRRDVAGHLAGCPDCAGRARSFSKAQEALAWTGEEEPVPAAVLQRMRIAARPRAARWLGWAAAGLLLAVSLSVWRRDAGTPPALVPAPVASRFLHPAPGMEILLGQGASYVLEGGRWRLLKGSCLVTAEGDIRLVVGALEVRSASGELFLSMREGSASAWLREAHAGEGGAEVAVLSGSALVLIGKETLVLEAGEALRSAGAKQVLPARELLGLRRGVAGGGRSLPGGLLDGRAGLASRLEASPAAFYQATAKLRMLEKPSALGLSFSVDGKPALWVPEESLEDGAWHVLGVSVSPAWVTLTLDGLPRRRVAREGFRPNPVAGVLGVGPVAWGGRLEVSELLLQPLQ